MDLLNSILIVFNSVNPILLLATFVGLAIFYITTLKSIVSSIFDPLFYAIFGSFFASWTAIALYLSDLISLQNIFWILIVTILFYFGVIIANKFCSHQNKNNNVYVPRIAIILVFIFFAASQITVYSITGIPLFMESRLEQFVSGGGIGIFGRLVDILGSVLLFLTFLRYKNNDKDILFYTSIISVLVTLILSGSKGGFILIFWAAHLSGFLSMQKSLSKSKLLLTMVSIGLIPLLVLMIQAKDLSSSGLINALTSFGFRLLAYGDVYSYAYVFDTYKSVQTIDYMALIYPLLQPIRLISPDQLPIPGFKLMAAVYDGWDPLTGPNPRLPLYLDFFYGRSFFPFAFLFGLILGIINARFHAYKGGWFGLALLFLLLIAACKIETDLIAFVVSLFNVILAFCVLLIIGIISKRKTT